MNLDKNNIHYKFILQYCISLIILFFIPCYAQSLHSTAYEYLQLWQSGEYSAMYDLLSDQSRTYISRGEFIDQHRDFAREYIIDDFDILEAVKHGQTATVYYRLELIRIGAGSETQNNRLHLVKEKDQWKIDY